MPSSTSSSGAGGADTRSAYYLPRGSDRGRAQWPDSQFDVCLYHSVVEAFDRPLDALHEVIRVLRPGGVLGAACVEYGGLVLAGPGYQLIRRFYDIRERLWLRTGSADPYRGRHLRGLLSAAGLVDVTATSKYICYGTTEAVRLFGLARAADCRDAWYATHARHAGLATRDDLDAMESAWRDWSGATDAYAAFAWCRAVGHKPLAPSSPSAMMSRFPRLIAPTSPRLGLGFVPADG